MFKVMKDNGNWIIFDTVSRVSYWGFKTYEAAKKRCDELNKGE